MADDPVPDGLLIAVGGLGKAPESFWKIGRKAAELLPGWAYREFSWNQTDEITEALDEWDAWVATHHEKTRLTRGVSHSFGAERLYTLARDDDYKFDRLAVLDLVHFGWSRDPLEKPPSVTDMKSWRKHSGLPPSVGLPGNDTVIYDVGHNEVIERVSGDVIDFLTKEVA